ncbi:ASPIC/UnbV domain-containing protein [bacterium]|nr:ASPIC/UnbV domain-containing protein [bacterium]
MSQSEAVVTVGLGAADRIDKLTVRWPGKDAGTRTWTNLAAGRTHTLTQTDPKP